MLKGLNHLTLAVSDIASSIGFYHHLLGLPLHARWDNGAYLRCGDLWLCLSLDAQRRYIAPQESDYTHYAFSIDENDFATFVARLTQAGVTSWKENRSEGESFYFLDPDGHKLEAHVGSLAQRLTACRAKPYKGMVFFDK
ncbi:FosA family fosfomycin resistance glutathione transferase [Phytobacter diazotrophicus]|uniref:FosA family fosfomycin resistance glutathione transferase n=1 Tax=Phytobacter diazotrophicus TaxID=395631 RepID=UPI0013EDB308|nr:FosA family fosfomycin resistance glutathione transferase [Phytobacter diazotrophicus]MDU7132599.1 FosA family fosfomycin resistance glutathione transferase [Enterobacteriaceae bacterium]QIH65402.1 glutathione transferase [Enterobacteriaceae bacterium A-F18]